MNETTPETSPPSGNVSGNRTVMIVLSYLWLLALVPLLVEKDDKEVQWHAKHGIVLMIAELILYVTVTILTVVLGSVLGCLMAVLFMPVYIGVLIVHIVCIVKGVNGQRFIIPGVSQYTERL